MSRNSLVAYKTFQLLTIFLVFSVYDLYNIHTDVYHSWMKGKSFNKNNLYTYHPISLPRALAKYDQNVYAPSVSGYNNLKVSIKPAAKKSVISSRSSLVNPAFLVFVLGFFKSEN